MFDAPSLMLKKNSTFYLSVRLSLSHTHTHTRSQELTELTVFVCRFSLMSATALCILLFRAAAGNVRNFVSEACLSMGEPVESLLDILRNCSPDSSPTLRRSQSTMDRVKRSRFKNLSDLRRSVEVM